MIFYFKNRTLYVRKKTGGEGDISSFIEKVIFYLHESFDKPKRGMLFYLAELESMIYIYFFVNVVIKKPPYELSETGYGNFAADFVIFCKLLLIQRFSI